MQKILSLPQNKKLLFPYSEKNGNLLYDEEGLYSITPYNEADYISKLILNNFINTNNNLNILDGNGGLGGNSISFSKYFKTVTSIEINKPRFEMLKNNIEIYGITNITLENCDSIQYLLNNYSQFECYFFDPPWGGHAYKKFKSLSFKMGDYKLIDIVDFIKNKTTNKLIIFKLPFNYNFDEFKNYNYKLHKIKNYYIILI
jgi:16S rRNA G966 N2-methylase RsmD